MAFSSFLRSFFLSPSSSSPSQSLTTTGRRFFKAGAENVEALFEPKFNWAAQNVEFTGKFSTGADYETGVSLKDVAGKVRSFIQLFFFLLLLLSTPSFLPSPSSLPPVISSPDPHPSQGSKVAVTGNQNAKGWSVKPAAEFKNELVAVKTSVVYPDDRVAKPVAVEASAVTAYENVLVGGKVNYATGFTAKGAAVDAATNYAVKAGFVQSLWQAVASFSQAAGSNVVGATYFQKVTDATTVGTSFSVDRLAANASPAASVASEYKYAADTTVKSKFAVTPAKDFRLGLALQQNWTSASTVTIGADLNALSLLGTNKGDAHSFGFEVKLK